jgi:tripeptidyl-peptidase-1
MARSLAVVALLCLVGMACASEPMMALSEGSLVPQNWEEVNVAVDYSASVNLTVALKRRNMVEFEKEVAERSNPQSPMYGQWFTREEIMAKTSPTPAALQAVLGWLHQSGVKAVVVGADKDTIELVDVPLNVAETVLDLQFHTYQEVNTMKTLIRAVGVVRVPESVSKYIQTIVGASGFPILHSLVKQVVGPELIAVTPDIINTRYNVSINAPTSPNNLKAVAEFQGQFIKQSDVDKFYTQYVLKGDSKIHSIIGFNIPEDPGVESTLDVEYIAATSADVPLDYYIFGGMDFCTDMIKWTTKLLAASNPGYVHSVSYGAQTKAPICDSSVRTQIDNNFMTLSGKGISIIIASGDSGSGYYSRSGFNGGALVPSWPAESPWCTAVGATYFQNGDLNVESAVTQFGSGGGFSWNENAIPAFQASAVASFFANYPSGDLPPSSSYNPTGRGTPDVSALGEMYTLIRFGNPEPGIGGTSASTPVFAGMVTRLNDIRLLAGKGTLGCINQLIYQNPQAFYDVTIGSDKIGQNTVGWNCQPGWDPVTGLGTPDYKKLEAIVQALP